MEEIIVSYSVPNPATPAARPNVVSWGGYLLYLAAAVWVIDGLIPLAGMSKVVQVYKDVYAGHSDQNAVVTGARVGLVVTAVLYVLLAVGAAILASFDLKGSNVARIITWVLSGLGVLCFGCGAVGSGLSGSVTSLSKNNTNGIDANDLARRVRDAEGSWFQPTDITLKLLGLIAVILVIIMLALPAASAFFRAGRTAQVPQGADPAYPAYPSYPQAPGTSAQPQYPPTPPYPGAQPPTGEQPPGQQPPAQQ